MLKNDGIQIRPVFFVNGPNGPTDFLQGVVRSVIATNKYDVIYDDNDEEEMGEAEFEVCKIKFKDQVVATNVQGEWFWKDVNDFNCANGHCYHPWSKDTNGFKTQEGGGAFTYHPWSKDTNGFKTQQGGGAFTADFRRFEG